MRVYRLVHEAHRELRGREADLLLVELAAGVGSWGSGFLVQEMFSHSHILKSTALVVLFRAIPREKNGPFRETYSVTTCYDPMFRQDSARGGAPSGPWTPARAQPRRSGSCARGTITNTRNEMTDLCGNWILRNNFINTFCEISS